MDNQFCKKCGQANFPNAASCTKCGTALAGDGNQSPSNFSDTPPPTMLPNQQFSNAPKPEKKSNKMYWIAGGVAGVLVLFIGLFAIVGLGGFLYLNSSKESPPKREIAEDIPKEDTTKNDDTDIDINDSSDRTGMTDSKLEDYMRNTRRRVGRYKLNNVKRFKGKDFSGRKAGVTAVYTSGSKKVVHSIAMFDSYERASRDFAKYKRLTRTMKGARVRSSQKDRIIFSYKGSMFLTFCNSAGGCHELISKNGNDILKYYDSYFGKS